MNMYRPKTCNPLLFFVKEPPTLTLTHFAAMTEIELQQLSLRYKQGGTWTGVSLDSLAGA
jgi:hypothetical protein